MAATTHTTPAVVSASDRLASTDVRGTSENGSTPSRTRSPTAAPRSAATRALSTTGSTFGRLAGPAAQSMPVSASPVTGNRASTPNTVTRPAYRASASSGVIVVTDPGSTRAGAAGSPSATAARTGRGKVATSDTPPNWRSALARRLPRSESPTRSAPVSTAAPTATPASTARLPRQWYDRLRPTSRVRVSMLPCP